ncbi:hypothetical protein F2Q69_00012404 [Brassica cretica]|uniref:Uncharacterized protein n=1 Tax=Brassica cretica TaxID=69181 RepID=A0A8S9R7G6_BRACR|nr:hypothetical protein F2Q69_00012404 [Brassica cretica]
MDQDVCCFVLSWSLRNSLTIRTSYAEAVRPMAIRPRRELDNSSTSDLPASGGGETIGGRRRLAAA